MILPALLLLATTPAAAAPDPVLVRMTTLYDELCLQAFPIDKALDEAMAAHHAVPLTPDEVKVTLVNDPGRGWRIDDGDHSIFVFLELPPYHACSVRRMTANGFADLSTYRSLADGFEADHRGFSAMTPYNDDRDGLHIHAVGEQRALPGGGGESLFVFDQRVTDPARRAKGETAVNVRFVHQIADPGAR